MQYDKTIMPVIEAHYSDFTSGEKTIADFFMKNQKMMDFSAKTIAGLLYTSEASLSRFAKKCGFNGYREFIYRYQESLNAKNASMDKQYSHIFNTYQELLNKSYSLIDQEQIHRIASQIANKKRIFIYGKGSSGIAGQELEQRFMRLGIDVQCITDSHVMKMSSVILNEECLLIGISVSGETKEILHVLEVGKIQGASTVLISSRQRKDWERFCDEILLIAIKENLNYGTLISPQFPILVVCDLLYANVLQFDFSEKQARHFVTLTELGVKENQ